MTNQQNIQSYDALASGRSNSDPFITQFSTRDPTANDTNYPIQKRWYNTDLDNEWILVDFTSFNGLLQANWQSVSSALAVETLTGNSGGPVGPDVNNNINVIGNGTTITIVGTPLNNTLTASTTGIVATIYTADAGSATPSGGNLNILGGTGVTTSGAGSTITINATNAGDMRSLGVQATSGGGTNPVLPDGAGKIEIQGALVSAGTNPIRSVSTAANTLQIQAQTSQALAATDATKVGFANFDSASFSVDANGFVTNKFPLTTASFTPTLAFGGASTGITYGFNTGYYTRIGPILFVYISIQLTSKGSSTGTATIENLPFTAINTISPPFMDTAPINLATGITFTATYTSAWGNFTSGTNSMSLQQGGSGVTTTAMQDTNFSNTSNFTLMGFYNTSAP